MNRRAHFRWRRSLAATALASAVAGRAALWVQSRLARTLRIHIVGPDGAGKTLVTCAILSALEDVGVQVVRQHYSPGVIRRGSPGTADTTQPQARQLRGDFSANLKVAATALDVWLDEIRRCMRGPAEVLLVERGFLDQQVDPQRYRLPAAAARTVTLWHRVLPRPDLFLLLTSDADVAIARKPELDVHEYARQTRAWVQLLHALRVNVVQVRTDVDVEVTTLFVQDLVAKLVPRPAPAARVPLTPRRLDLRVQGGTTRARLQAAALYTPLTTRAVCGRAVGLRLADRSFADQTAHPLLSLLVDKLGYNPDLVATCSFRSSEPTRRLVALADDSQILHVVKLGTADDRLLVREQEALRRLHALGFGNSGRVQLPEITEVLRFGGYLALAQRWATGSPGMSEAALADVCFALQALEPPWVHGDLAPWNVRTDGEHIRLLDFEQARVETAPLWDYLHYRSSQAALLGGGTPADLAAALLKPDSTARALVAALAPGEDYLTRLKQTLVVLANRDPNATRASFMLNCLAVIESYLDDPKAPSQYRGLLSAPQSVTDVPPHGGQGHGYV